jgi:hypothetical protein
VRPPLPALHDQRTFSPLRLRHTSYQPQGPIEGPHTTGYLIGDDGSLTEATAWTAGKGADGAIVTNAAEEATFLKGLVDDELGVVSSSKTFSPPPASIQEAAPPTLYRPRCRCGRPVLCVLRPEGHPGGGAAAQRAPKQSRSSWEKTADLSGAITCSVMAGSRSYARRGTPRARCPCSSATRVGRRS